jgi:predicted RNA-binding protein with PUA-like domain
VPYPAADCDWLQRLGRVLTDLASGMARSPASARNGTMREMKFYLAKTDPESYSIADLERDQKTTWDGVRNPQALRAIGEMRSGDRVFVYHSQGAAAVVGLAKVVSDPRPDPRDAKLTVVDFEFLTNLEPPTTLREVKESGLFADWSLVRQGRLSTMAAPPAFVEWMRKRYPKTKL